MSSGNTSSDNPITENPLDMAEDFGIGLAMVALVSILQHLAIAKFYTGGSLSFGMYIFVAYSKELNFNNHWKEKNNIKLKFVNL